MLNDFFRINLPYGIAKNVDGEWMAFNREYMPLGYNNTSYKGNPGKDFLDLPVYTKYDKISDKLLAEIAWGEEGIFRDDNDKIVKVFLYNDRSNPLNQKPDKAEIWDDYFEKLKKLSKVQIG